VICSKKKLFEYDLFDMRVKKMAKLSPFILVKISKVSKTSISGKFKGP
jgi:hypothetical protein